jgi:hypothetical protein
MPQGGADLPMEIRHAGEVLLGAVIGEAALPDADRGVHPAHPQRDVALLLADASDDRRVERLGDLQGGRVPVEGLSIGVEGRRRVAGRLE